MGYIRRNHLVPIPSFESFDALNAYLEEQCTKRLDVRLKGRTSDSELTRHTCLSDAS